MKWAPFIPQISIIKHNENLIKIQAKKDHRCLIKFAGGVKPPQTKYVEVFLRALGAYETNGP